MAVDPTDPETFEDEEAEDAPDIGVEAPEGDAAEQLADLAPRRDEPVPEDGVGKASEGDLAEQARIVELDEDDYR